MRTQYRMRNKVVASIAAAAMAASMVVAVPGAAFATYDEGSIEAKTTTAVNTTVGTQVNMADYFTYSASGGDGAWHVDYKVTEGSAATVNKHSGLLTAASEGDVTVTAWLTGVAIPADGTKNNPCDSGQAKYSATVTVHVTEASTYGYQGKKLGIKMTSPTITKYSGSNAEGWVNTATGATATDGYYLYTISMNNGFKSYATASAFAGINAGNVELQDDDGNEVAVLDGENNGEVKIYSVDADAKTIVVAVDVNAVGEKYRLVFTDAFRANNASNILDTTVSFVIG